MKKFALAGFTLLTGLVMAEFALRALTPYPIHGVMSNRVADEILTHRLSPSMKDMDNSGFRNSTVLESTELLAIGDSHTYGYNVTSEQSWPQLIGQKCNQPIYNLGIPGYGILEYLHLFKRGLTLQPKHIIIAVYLPNDLKNICDTLKVNDYWMEWALQEQLDIAPCQTLKNYQAIKHSQRKSLKTAIKKTAIGSLLWMIRANKIYPRIPNKNIRRIAHPSNPTFHYKRDIKIRKQFTDLTNPAIFRAFEISQHVIHEIKNTCDQNDIKLSVAIIPSKERVYYPYLQEEKLPISPDVERLVYNERMLTIEFQNFLKDTSIPNTDVTPYVEKALANSRHVYPQHQDTHPEHQGYRAYADAIFKELIEAPNTN